MRSYFLARRALPFFLLCAVFSLGSCKDSDFDFDNIDELLGFGGEELQLPGNNSTSKISLDDFLELNNSDFVHIASNGDYELSMTDNNVNTSTTSVNAIHLVNPSTTNKSVAIPSAILNGASGTEHTATIDAVLASFDYKVQSVSSDIKALDDVTFSTEMSFHIAIPSVLNKVRTMVVSLPAFLDLGSATIDGSTVSPSSDNTFTLSNLATGNHTLKVNIQGARFGSSSSHGNISFDAARHTVALYADVNTKMTLSTADVNSSASGSSSINGSLSIGDITVTGAKGRFSPSISFENLGSVSLNNIPNFLTDKQVCLDLYDPHVDINFTNGLPLRGKVSGTMRALDATGKVIASVNVPEFLVPVGNSVVSIRKQVATLGADSISVVVPTLTELIKTIPAKIEFVNIHAVADDSQTAEIRLATNYEVKAKYSFDCPLQFDSDAVVVYDNSMDGWNDGVKDLMFKEKDGSVDGYLQVEADIANTIPAYLTISATGIDTQGNEISQNDLAVTVDKTIAASTDGVTPVETTVTIKLQPTTNDVFKRLDGLRYHLVGSARDADGANAVTGKTLNAYNQSLKATNIKVTKHGKVVYNAN